MSYAVFAQGAKAAFVAPEGLVLTEEEVALFQAKRPFGYILFARNCQSPEQVANLVQQLKEVSGHPNVPILIDQEGGRVMRLKPPVWPRIPSMKKIGDLYQREKQAGEDALRLCAQLLAAELSMLGISANCAPVCDVLQPETHDIIGDRAFSSDPEVAARLSKIFVEETFSSGILPIAKHVPGHGRATVDSHLDLPIVSASETALENVDFVPFRALLSCPLMMVAHVIYTALDKAAPSSLSPIILKKILREKWGYQGVLISDDISMRAVPLFLGTEDVAETAQAHLFAGCDFILHCNGKFEELSDLLSDMPNASEEALQRWARAEKLCKARAPLPLSKMKSLFEMQERLETLL